MLRARVNKGEVCLQLADDAGTTRLGVQPDLTAVNHHIQRHREIHLSVDD